MTKTISTKEEVVCWHCGKTSPEKNWFYINYQEKLALCSNACIIAEATKLEEENPSTLYLFVEWFRSLRNDITLLAKATEVSIASKNFEFYDQIFDYTSMNGIKIRELIDMGRQFYQASNEYIDDCCFAVAETAILSPNPLMAAQNIADQRIEAEKKRREKEREDYEARQYQEYLELKKKYGD